MDGRISTGSRSEPAARVIMNHGYNVDVQNVVASQKRNLVKMISKVQVVYYLTRNGHLEHPHYLEVSHLATQPLRLKDVIERLTILRGKAMACQYSWSCKRSYKSGYVWNDLSENDVIYASEGSEYVLKGSELIHHTDISEMKAQEFEFKGRKEAQVKPKPIVISTSVGHSFRQTEKPRKHDVVDNEEDEDDDEEEEEEDKGSYNESCSLPSTSSTNSDKPVPPPTPALAPAKMPMTTKTTLSKKVKGEKDVDSCSLTRNTVLLQLIACGGVPKQKTKPMNPKPNDNNSFNFNSVRSSIMPCLTQQLSTKRGVISDSTTNSGDRVPVVKDNCSSCNCKTNDDRREDEEEDEDMIMVKFMSENPRFGNQQSQEKEYFSGTIVETMGTHHHHTPSSASASNLSNPVFTKSSSYNEQRSTKSEMQAAVQGKEEGKEKGVKVKAIIKCIPRRKSYGSNSSKSPKI